MLAFLSLAVTNCLWQLIDVSNLQRLQSVQPSDDERSDRRRLARGLAAAGFESAGAWTILFLLAVALSLLNVGAGQLRAVLSFDPYASYVLVPVFGFIVIAFLLSTVDILIAAAAYVAYYDILPAETMSISEPRNIFVARWITFLFLVFSALLYFVLRESAGTQFAQALYGIYAFQASVFPVFLFSFLPVRLRYAPAGVLSILSGWVAGILTALSPNPWLGISA